MIEDKLKKLGLKTNEIKVYLSLFEVGRCRANKIIEATDLHRNLVYTALEKLIEKELVSKVIKNGVAIFEANSPESLIEMVENKKNIAEEIAEELKKKQEVTPRDIKILEGTEGIKQVRLQVANNINKGEDYCVLGASQKNTNPELEKFWPRLNKKILDRGGKIRALVAGDNADFIIRSRGLTEGENARLMNPPIESPMWLSVFRDIVNISIVGDDPLTFSIRNQETADGFREYFEYFWNQDMVVDYGDDALKKAFYSMADEMKAEEEYFVFGASFGDKQKELGLFDFFVNYHKYRLKRGVKANLLAFGNSYEYICHEIDLAGDPERKLTTVKKWSETSYNPIQINLYNNKVVLVIYEERPVVMYINKPQVYAGFKKYFDSLWNQESYVLQGAKALQELWLEATDTKDVRWIGARGYFMDNHPELYKAILEKSKNTKGLIWKNIVDPTFKGHELTTYPWSQTKYLLSDKAKNPNVVWLLGEKIAITNWTEKEPIIFVSHNKFLVQSYYDYFDELWGNKDTDVQIYTD